ncbi:hypothetical protein LCL97_12540 [Seohaeicola saemankumensis]|nr:hypothetical protein [Seohaeicola saemankumensis]MCA0871658.1 hypothetical protein [Seohaeicola saemankumensis]
MLRFIFPLSCALASPVAAEFCPEMQMFRDSVSDTIEEDDFHVGYTSGFAVDRNGAFLYRRCIENLHGSGWVSFKWKGPRPSTLLSGTLPRGRAKIEAWKRSLKPQERDLRELGLSVGDDYEYFDVDSFFESAEATGVPAAPGARITRVQAVEDPVLSEISARDFFDQIEGGLREQEQTVFSMNSGIIASIPADAEDWTAYLERSGGTDDPPPLSAFTVIIGTTYDFEKEEIGLSASLGVDALTSELTVWPQLAGAVTLRIGGLQELGLEAVDQVVFEADQAAEPLFRSFAGGTVDIPLGSFSDARTDDGDIGLVTRDLPVTVSLQGVDLFGFYIEAIGLTGPI